MRNPTVAVVTTDHVVERARRGDRAAFDELYERNAGRVYALCFRLTGDPRRAEELTQDAFVRAWQRIGSFRGESLFSTWLHRLAVNVAIDAQRKRGREGHRTENIETSALPDGLAGEPEARLELERAIARLPDRARTALVLHTIEGYRYREVAELMDVALGTVKALIFQARARLLEELDPEPNV